MTRIDKSIDYLTKYAYGGECGQDAAKHLIKLLAEVDFMKSMKTELDDMDRQIELRLKAQSRVKELEDIIECTKKCHCTTNDGTVPKCGT